MCGLCMLHDQHKPWVWMLTHKYLKEDNVFLTKEYKGCYYTWASIIKVAYILEPGFKFRVGRGETFVWYDRWSLVGHICSMIDYVHYQDAYLKLKDFYQDGEWQWDWLAIVLPQEVRKEFISLYLCPTVEDSIIWDASSNGCYTSKTSYQ